MTSRERVTRILNHQEADRIAIDLGDRVASKRICISKKTYRTTNKLFYWQARR